MGYYIDLKSISINKYKEILKAADLGLPVYKSIGFLNKGEIKVFNLIRSKKITKDK